MLLRTVVSGVKCHHKLFFLREAEPKFLVPLESPMTCLSHSITGEFHVWKIVKP